MSKEVKEGSWESRGAQKHKNSVVYEILQPKIAPCEIATLLRNYFAAPRSRCENATLLRNDFAAPCPPLRKFSQLRNHPLAHECHFAAPYTHFAAAKWLWNPPHLKILQRAHHEQTCHSRTPIGHIFEALTGAQIMHTISCFEAWEVRSPVLQTVHDLELKRRSYGRLKMTVQSWTEMLQPHPISLLLDTFLEHFLEIKLCIPYFFLKLRNSGVQCFKRCTIWIWNEEVMVIWRRYTFIYLGRENYF